MNTEKKALNTAYRELFATMALCRSQNFEGLRVSEVGTVVAVGAGTATLHGLPGVGAEELVTFSNGLMGTAFDLGEYEVGVLLLGEWWNLHANDTATRTGRVLDVPVGEKLLGRVIDPLGNPLDHQGEIRCPQRCAIEKPAPAIVDRLPVSTPLQTGIKAIDALIPIGRGQRELIVGDRQTGKTALAIDTILNQKETDVISIYCAIGQRASSVARTISDLRSHGAMGTSIVILAEPTAAPGLLFIAPYAATTIAEHFMAKGKDVLIVYDSLTHHARAYREISLLLRRPPGREAFPGDVFYIHSRLLERATHLHARLGGGSLTALPIVETEAQNISAYIPTNLISITDGQIYLSPILFSLGILPAIDIGKSVSRVGGKAQLAAYRAAAGHIKLSYSQFEERESFSRFDTKLDAHTQHILEHGRRIRACLKQPQLAPVPVVEQILLLMALTMNSFDNILLENMLTAEHAVRGTAQRLSPQTTRSLLAGEVPSEFAKQEIFEAINAALAHLRTKP
jgi:F-type H+-transporting ATPase subunit alpha